MTPRAGMSIQHNAPMRRNALDIYLTDPLEDDLAIPFGLVETLRLVEGQTDGIDDESQSRPLSPPAVEPACRAFCPPTPRAAGRSFLQFLEGFPRLWERTARLPALRCENSRWCRAVSFLGGAANAAGFCMFAVLFALCVAAPLVLILLLGQELAR